MAGRSNIAGIVDSYVAAAGGASGRAANAAQSDRERVQQRCAATRQARHASAATNTLRNNAWREATARLDHRARSVDHLDRAAGATGLGAAHKRDGSSRRTAAQRGVGDTRHATAA